MFAGVVGAGANSTAGVISTKGCGVSIGLAVVALSASSIRDVVVQLAFPIAYDEILAADCILLDIPCQCHDNRRVCFMLAAICRCQPAWGLSLYQLRIVGSDAVRDLGYRKVRWDSMQEELAKSLSDFHFLALTVVRKGVCNDRRIVFVDDVILGGTSSEYDVATDRNSRTDEWRCENIFVVNNRGVDPTESQVCQGLSLLVGFLRVDAIRVVGIAALEVAGHFPFGLWIVCWNKLWQADLRLLGFWRHGLPSSGAGSWYLGRRRCHCGSSIVRGSSSTGCISTGYFLRQGPLEDFLDRGRG